MLEVQHPDVWELRGQNAEEPACSWREFSKEKILMPKDAQTSEVEGESKTNYLDIHTSSKISNFLCEFHQENKYYAPE